MSSPCQESLKGPDLGLQVIKRGDGWRGVRLWAQVQMERNSEVRQGLPKGEVQIPDVQDGEPGKSAVGVTRVGHYPQI